MTVDQRMEANAIIDRLVGADDSFAIADARRLIELIPLSRSKWLDWGMSLFASHRGGSTRGRAAGVGDVDIENGENSRSWTLNSNPQWRVGGYKVSHTPGEIEIDHFFEGTPVDLKPTARLEYGQSELLLKISVDKTIQFGPFALVRRDFDPWKHPRG